MIIFLKNGRLGNQYIQAAGLDFFFPNEKVILINFKELVETFDVNQNTRIKNLKINKYVFILLHFLLQIMVVLKLFGRITEINKCDTFEIVRKKGIFYNLSLAEDIFFQHKDLLNNFKSKLTLKVTHIDKARNWLFENIIDLGNTILIFIHIRRGDYLFVPSKANPAAVDVSWVKEYMEYFNSKFTNARFILMGDDLEYLTNAFEKMDTLTISKNDESVDLALMSFCKYGIMSPSSFALVGAHIAKTNYLDTQFVAPKYWMGHSVGSWIPSGIETNWIDYKDTTSKF
jgi:hypothetical protein